MMNVRKSRVSLALSAILAGGAVAATPGVASAQVLNPNGTGSALIFPYYTANGGWSTLFNITNTSDDFLAVKVRFREQENSRDVLDFNVVMSPQDVWTGWVSDGPNGPRFRTRDESCTSPILPTGPDGAAYVDFQDAAFTGASNDGGSTGIERAAEGHLEVFVMGKLPDEVAQSTTNGSPDYPTAYWADHKHLDCTIVDNNFKAGPGAVEPSEDNNATNTSQNALAGDPPARDDFWALSLFDAPLKGNVSFINTGRGVGAGSTALHIEGFGANFNSDSNLVTAQEFPYFLEPTLASNQGLWRWSFIQDFFWGRVFNEWSVNANTGASTDWIIAFPDKYLHVDIYDDLQAGVNLVRLADALGDDYCVSVPGGYACDGSTTASTLVGALTNSSDLDNVLFPFSEPFDGQSCDEVVFDLWDREENGVQGSGTSISPAPPVPASSLCYETNVITFGGADSVLDSRLAQTIDVSGLTSGASFGWMDLRLSTACPPNTPCKLGRGLPVTGFAMKERDFGDPNRNYGQLMDHGYGFSGGIPSL